MDWMMRWGIGFRGLILGIRIEEHGMGWDGMGWYGMGYGGRT